MRNLVIDACLKHGVPVIQERGGEVWFKVHGVEAVLGAIPNHFRVIGFEGMTMAAEGWKMLRGNLNTNFGSGTTIADALATVTDWPREPEYWMTVLLHEIDVPSQRLLMDACWKHGVFFAWVGIFIIERRGIEKVLHELPPQVRVLGLDAVTFDFEGRTSWYQMEYRLPDLDDGVPIEKALAVIADWPRDEALWISVTLLDPDASTP
jgi:hypothetical protein